MRERSWVKKIVFFFFSSLFVFSFYYFSFFFFLLFILFKQFFQFILVENKFCFLSYFLLFLSFSFYFAESKILQYFGRMWGKIWQILILLSKPWRWQTPPDCEIPNSPDTLHVLLPTCNSREISSVIWLPYYDLLCIHLLIASTALWTWLQLVNH